MLNTSVFMTSNSITQEETHKVLKLLFYGSRSGLFLSSRGFLHAKDKTCEGKVKNSKMHEVSKCASSNFWVSMSSFIQTTS